MFLILWQLHDKFLISPDSFFLVSICLALLIDDPLFCSLIVPFLRLGEAVTGSGHFPLTADALKNVLTGHASKDVLMSIVHAVSEQPFRNQSCSFVC
jgi:hypothetical protein